MGTAARTSEAAAAASQSVSCGEIDPRKGQEERKTEREKKEKKERERELRKGGRDRGRENLVSDGERGIEMEERRER